MKKGKKRVSILLCGMILLSSVVMSACSNQAEPQQGEEKSTSAANVNPAGEFPICKEPITIQVGIIQNANVEDFDSNALTLWYEEKGNFDLQFEYFPAKLTEAQQKLEIMVASGGELPEVLIGFEASEESVLNYGIQGAVIPLNSYIEEYGYYINSILDDVQNKEIINWMASADGNVYYLGKANEQIGNMYALRSWINQTWLDNLGLDMPTTTEEFYDVLKAFVTQDPNGNGTADEIGMIGGTGWRSAAHDFLMNAFIYNDTDCRWLVQDGKLDVAFNKPEWRDGLSYLNRLVSEGLLLPQSFTMDDSQVRQLTEAGEQSQVGVITAGTLANVFSATNERKTEYVPLPPLTGPDGACYATYFPVIPIKNFMITKDAKNPEAIFRWGDLMFSEEGYKRTRWGIPETDWKEPESDDHSLLEDIGIPASIVPILPWGSVQNSHWNYITAGIIPYGVTDGQVLSDDPLNADIWVAQAIPYYQGKEAQERADLLKYSLEEAEEIREMKNTIYTYVKESMARFAVGDLNIETDWDSYCAEFDAMGLDKYLEYSQNAYERAK
jgi:putative aldouronate transport system substrate-binding protein